MTLLSIRKRVHAPSAQMVGVFFAPLLALSPLIATAQTPVKEWRVDVVMTSGNLQTCRDNYAQCIMERDGQFVLKNCASRYDALILPINADGSVTAEGRHTTLFRNMRLNVPAGSGPRVFDLLDTTNACRYTATPAMGRGNRN